MLVDREDYVCPECKGQLEIDEIDDCSMFVVCTECGHDMQVEPDAFGDGCMKYYVVMQAKQEGLDPDDLFL
jgi:DNA-directed RNA polymerase subunit RPC12/RpoP